MRGEIHHIDLTVRDLDASRPFYRALLEFMGYHHDKEEEWVLADGHAATSINLVQARGPHANRAHDRYSSGLHHLAFRAESRSDVDRMYDRMCKAGATILDAPADYPQYNHGQGYYAAFFADPDGMKLEFVYTP